MGATFDWSAEVVTCDPDYYRWNQWFFLQFLKAGLAYRAKSPVDWCPNDGTLAREQVEGADRHCWRCGAKVEKRDLDQWYLRVTKYADELLDFSEIQFPDPVRVQQTNWIGRSEGGEIVFDDGAVRPPRGRRGAARLHDAAGHAVRGDVHGPGAGASAGRGADRAGPARRGRGVRRARRDRDRDRAAVDGSREDRRADRRRRDQPRQRRAHPDLRRRLRAGRLRHRRDHGRPRARRARLRVRAEVRAADPPCRRARRARRTPTLGEAYIAHSDDEVLVNSGEFSGLPADEGGRRIVASLEQQGKGKAAVTYRLRDWLISRQRYWGTPIPVIHCPTARHRARPRRGPAGPAARHGRLRGQRGEPADPRRGVPERSVPDRRRAGEARDRHDGHVHRLVLVLVSLPVAAQAGRPDRRRPGRDVDAGRAVHRRRRARRDAPAVRPRVHEDDARHRAGPAERAVEAGLQPGPDPGRRRRAHVEVARQRPGPRRAGRAVRRRHGPPVPDVHGPVGPGRAVEPDRDRRRPPLPEPRLDDRARPARHRAGRPRVRRRCRPARTEAAARAGLRAAAHRTLRDVTRRLRGLPLQHDGREADGAVEHADALPRHDRRRLGRSGTRRSACCC